MVAVGHTPVTSTRRSTGRAVAGKSWASSRCDVSWCKEGFDDVKLRYLAMLSGLYYNAHRAVADCEAAIELLSRPLPVAGRPALACCSRKRVRTYRRSRSRIGAPRRAVVCPGYRRRKPSAAGEAA